ncbi:MAG: hypothetical protein JW984_06580 [Deltaproteobacteria bacterium]|uniref:Uncharacterized protein n=1 Tax=Candidatus Zymogenus saltonus TaxID=2844893 RepID=A0A9D8KES8_9DELT|nr:hypothetical protein [Candidatus Zymogenus saltonus]
MSDIEWKIGFGTDNIEEEYYSFFIIHPDQQLCKDHFEIDVKNNPFYHPKPKRIVKLQGKKYKGIYRWKESNTRVMYHIDRPDKTVYVIKTGTATGISYKKR